MSPASGLPPSLWVQRWAHLIAPASRVLDLACGAGRHTAYFAALGHAVTAVDRDGAALASLRELATTRCLDLEQTEWPLAGETFDAVVVTNYLWRGHFDHILRLLAPGGVLIYETFAIGHASVGRPSRADFLLTPGELLQRCSALRVVAFEDGFESESPRFVQRIAAVRPPPGVPALPARYHL